MRRTFEKLSMALPPSPPTSLSGTGPAIATAHRRDARTSYGPSYGNGQINDNTDTQQSGYGTHHRLKKIAKRSNITKHLSIIPFLVRVILWCKKIGTTRHLKLRVLIERLSPSCVMHLTPLNVSYVIQPYYPPRRRTPPPRDSTLSFLANPPSSPGLLFGSRVIGDNSGG